MASDWIGNYTGNLIVHLTGNLTYVVAFFYVFYKLFHLAYRYHRLLRHSPYGMAYTIATLFPVTASLVISVFDLPVEIVDAPLSSPIAIAFLASLVAIPYVLPLVFVKLRAEPSVLSKTRSTSSAENST